MPLVSKHPGCKKNEKSKFRLPDFIEHQHQNYFFYFLQPLQIQAANNIELIVNHITFGCNNIFLSFKNQPAFFFNLTLQNQILSLKDQLFCVTIVSMRVFFVMLFEWLSGILNGKKIKR